MPLCKNDTLLQPGATSFVLSGSPHARLVQTTPNTRWAICQARREKTEFTSFSGSRFRLNYRIGHE